MTVGAYRVLVLRALLVLIGAARVAGTVGVNAAPLVRDIENVIKELEE